MFRKDIISRILSGLDRFYAPDDGAIGEMSDLDVIGDENDDNDENKDDDNKDDDKTDDEDAEDDNTPDDGNTDDEDKDNDNDEDENKEDKEDENEEVNEDEKRLTAWTDIKKKYPDFGKQFPDIKAALFREDRYSQILGSPEAAEEAVEKSNILDSMSQDLIGNGDPTILLDTVLKQNKESFEKVALSILPYLQEKDKNLYYEVASVPIKQLLRAAYADGKGKGKDGKDSDIALAALHLHKWFFSDLELNKELKGEKAPAKTEKTAREKELEEKLNNINNKELQSFNNSVDTSYINKMTENIRAGLDKDSRLSEYTKTKLAEDILRAINVELKKDTAHTARLESLWTKGRNSGFTNDLKTSIINTALVRAKSLVPTIRQKLVSEAVGKAKKQEGNNKVATFQKREPKSSSNNKPSSNKPLTDIEILRGK